MILKNGEVLITIPSAGVPGGVGNYYKIFKKHASGVFLFFLTGARDGEITLLKTGLRLTHDFISFLKALLEPNLKLVVLNPSFDPRSLIRDGVYLLTAKLLNKKAVVFFRGWHTKWEDLVFNRFGFLFKIVFFKADAMIVLASGFKEKLENQGYSRPIFLETTIVDQTVFNEIQTEKTYEAVKNYKSGLNILFLSRVTKEKGIYEAIDAFKILKSKYSNITLTVAGDGNEKKDVMEYVINHGIEDINFLGHITGEEKRQAFQSSDVYLFPTCHGEGMPNSLLEAMAYGLPIITRPAGGIKDFFQDGKMGFITESLKPEVFASLLEELIRNKNLVKKISVCNHKFAFTYFSSSQVIRRVANICNLVINDIKINTSHSYLSPLSGRENDD